MKQMVVGLLVVVGVFTVGPWFAGKVGPTLADAITDYATSKQPCATATADPSKKPHPKRAHPKKARPHKDRPHAARKHQKPHAEQRAKQRHPSKTKPSPTCAPRPSRTPAD